MMIYDTRRLPRPTLPRPTQTRPSIPSPALQVPAATPAAPEPAQPSAFVTQLIEHVAQSEQTVLPHSLSPLTVDDENALPAFLVDENWVPTAPNPEPPPEPAWDDPYGAGIAPSELAMRENRHRSHGAPAHRPPTDLPHAQRPPRPKLK